MSWPRRHELIDLDLDQYAEEEDISKPADPRSTENPVKPVVERRSSVLDAAERAGVPLEELLPKLDP